MGTEEKFGCGICQKLVIKNRNMQLCHAPLDTGESSPFIQPQNFKNSELIAPETFPTNFFQVFQFPISSEFVFLKSSPRP